jgi:hypothetical protein
MCKLPGSYVNAVTNFDWPYAGNQYLGAGMIGLQEFQSTTLSDLYSMTLNYSNLTDWTFASPLYKESFTSSVLLSYSSTSPVQNSGDDSIVI